MFLRLTISGLQALGSSPGEHIIKGKSSTIAMYCEKLLRSLPVASTK